MVIAADTDVVLQTLRRVQSRGPGAPITSRLVPHSADPVFARRAALAVVTRLRDQGHVAYFAGGCVRDALLGLSPVDYDVATDAHPDRVAALFKRAQLVGASFGVVLVPMYERDLPAGDRPGGDRRATVEVATFRTDGPYHDARRPAHVIFADAPTDARRRDFTINALFLDPLAPRDEALGVDGQVLDFVGGVPDLRARVLRAVGDPDQRLAEDHLRALRAARFAARFSLAVDPGTADAIRRHAGELRGVSRERIGEEIRRMLAHPAADRALTLLHELTLDAPALAGPGLSASVLRLVPGVVAALHARPGAGGSRSARDPWPTPPVGVTVLAAWLLDRARALGGSDWPEDGAAQAMVQAARTALCLSNEDSAGLLGALAAARRAGRVGAWTRMSVAERKRLAGHGGFPAGLVLVRAAEPATAETIARDVRELAQDGIGIRPHPLVTGDDLVALGWKPGPQFKRVLERVYDEQLEGRVRSREDALELAESLRV